MHLSVASGTTPADPDTTGQVMQFRVRSEPDASTPVEDLQFDANPGSVPLLADEEVTGLQDLALLEEESSKICVDDQLAQIPGLTPPDCGPLGSHLDPRLLFLVLMVPMVE